MNEAGTLALIGELYEQVRSLAAENERLKQSQEAEQAKAFDPLAGPEEAIAKAREESEAKPCEHLWEDAERMLLTQPPQPLEICKRCGAERTASLVERDET